MSDNVSSSNVMVKIINDHNEAHIHVFDLDSLDAINAALSINRPLLIRGEPGIGKSQLAKAAAALYKRAYIPFVVNANTEANDLLWSFDAVARLADAQMEAVLCKTVKERKQVKEQLALHHYIQPRPLWAALNWQSAQDQYDVYNKHKNHAINPLNHYFNHDKAQANGVVLLIDEIDKADSRLPNGLLEVLGTNRFHPQGIEKAIEVSTTHKPLIIITTNEERILPDAFIRRCLSITFSLPKGHREQMAYLVNNAKPNFPDLDKAPSEPLNEDHPDWTILHVAADMILKDRQQAKKNNLHPLPGQAEYFDLLRGIQAKITALSVVEVVDLLKKLSRFTSKKHPDFPNKAG